MICFSRTLLKLFIVIVMVVYGAIFSYQFWIKHTRYNKLINENSADATKTETDYYGNLQMRKDSFGYSLNSTLMNKVYQGRRTRIREACSQEARNINSQFNVLEKNLTSLRKTVNPIAYCNIPKVASTFWKKILSMIPSRSKPPTKVNTSFSETYTAEGHQLRTLFVRNPYERALSGYIDKLFGPNTMFWNIVGKYVVQRYRTNPTNRSRACGHDVTFPEFMKYIIGAEKDGQKRNSHFYPMSSQCSLCRVDYDVIGKFDTFKQDTDFILNYIYRETGINLSNMIASDAMETLRIQNKIHLTFTMKRRITQCMTFLEALERVWRNFQVRGLMGKNVSIPLSKKEADTLTAEEVIDVFLKARDKSGDVTYRKANKYEAMIEVFQSVPPSDLDMYIQMFKSDFEFFGYETKPDNVFKMDAIFNNTYKYLPLNYKTDGTELLM